MLYRIRPVQVVEYPGNEPAFFLQDRFVIIIEHLRTNHSRKIILQYVIRFLRQHCSPACVSRISCRVNYPEKLLVCFFKLIIYIPCRFHYTFSVRAQFNQQFIRITYGREDVIDAAKIRHTNSYPALKMLLYLPGQFHSSYI